MQIIQTHVHSQRRVARSVVTGYRRTDKARAELASNWESSEEYYTRELEKTK